MDIKKELRDQSAHAIAALVILGPLLACPSVFTALFAGFGIGFVRELTEEGKPVTLAKAKAALHSWLDLLVWSLGGLLAYLLLA